jgi:hypothetical protein
MRAFPGLSRETGHRGRPASRSLARGGAVERAHRRQHNVSENESYTDAVRAMAALRLMTSRTCSCPADGLNSMPS